MRRRLFIVSLTAALLYLPSVPSGAGAPEVTAEEQWFIYDLNRARRDPIGYAEEHGINLSDPPPPQPPLAVNSALMTSTGNKVAAMDDWNRVDHLCDATKPWGTTNCPDRLAALADYPITNSSQNSIEAIWGGGPGGYPAAAAFMSNPCPPPNQQGPTHMCLLFEWGDRREIGAGLVSDATTSYFATHVAVSNINPGQPFITGVVYDDGNANCIMDLGEGMAGVTVSAAGKSLTTNAGGGYSIPVAAGTYQVTVSGSGFTPQATAQVVVGSDNVGLDFIKGEAEPIPPGCVDRWWGANRYATAVAISQATHPSGADVVYLASGVNFPDAVAAGPAAAVEDAPILLATPQSIPSSTASELDRLGPSTVVILGGEAALGATIVNQVRSILGSSVAVDRRWGATRYETAVEISKRAFPGGVSRVYIATGEDFPDAISGAPAAIATGGALLLVRPDQIPLAVSAELARLHPTKIFVLGSSAAVSDAVLNQLKGFAPQGAQRISGSNRYATAVEASKHAFPTASTVYIAVGTNYPDALTGGAATAVANGPILLVAAGHLPAGVGLELTRLGPSRIIVFGGPDAVSAAVASALTAYVVL